MTPPRPQRERVEPGTTRAFRGRMLHFLRDPGDGDEPHAWQYLEDGVLLVESGHVAAFGEARTLLASLPGDVPVEDLSGHLILPGFVDAHVHYPQTDIIASDAHDLLSWLDAHTFPAERAFRDGAYAREVAAFFVQELLRNGTTTAMVFATVHPASVDALFEAAAAHDMRLVAGKVLMDRHCPTDLRDTPESGYRESQALIRRWHGTQRLSYAVTPRFAPTSSERQLELAGQLLREHPDVFMQTHLAESAREVAWVAELFPSYRSYLDVYDRFGLLRSRSVLAHCLHIDDTDRARLRETGAAIAFCPTSNLFLGSGLFDLAAAARAQVPVAMGTDVGGGTSFGLLQTLNEAYKVAQMQSQRLTPFRALYLATLGGARALDLHDRIGNFETGKEADFVVVDPASTPLITRRLALAADLAAELLVLMMLGDDRAIAATYLMGQQVYDKRCQILLDGAHP